MIDVSYFFDADDIFKWKSLHKKEEYKIRVFSKCEAREIKLDV